MKGMYSDIISINKNDEVSIKALKLESGCISKHYESNLITLFIYSSINVSSSSYLLAGSSSSWAIN